LYHLGPFNCPTYGFQIGVVIEDKELTDSYMDGKPWKAGKFSLTLRLSLWSEHLGLPAGEVSNFPFLESSCLMCLINNDYFYILSSGQSNNGPNCWFYIQGYLDDNSKGNKKDCVCLLLIWL
jgi:hypothetical protein